MPDQGAQQPNQQNQKSVDELKRQIEKARADGKDVTAMEQELQKLQKQPQAQAQGGQSRQGGQEQGQQRR